MTTVIVFPAFLPAPNWRRISSLVSFTELTQEYNLDELDIKIINSYLQLEPDERAVFKKYLKNILQNK